MKKYYWEFDGIFEYLNMDGKQQAATAAAEWVQPHTRIGLGAGTTMAYLAEALRQKIQDGLQVTVFSSSAETRLLLQQLQVSVADVATTDYLDWYFDGCDQFDRSLNALKSGGGIHTSEKLLAAMAREFILVGDETKYAEQLTNRYPVVAEVLPGALAFVETKLRQAYPQINKLERRYTAPGQLTQTVYGNYLLDIWFSELPGIAGINPLLKSIPGIVETSLFYGMASRAIVAGAAGVRVIEKQ